MLRKTMLATVALAVVLATAASAYESRLRNSRIAAPNKAAVMQLAKFYNVVFGYQVTQTLNLDGGRTELVLNIGKTVDEARRNPVGQLLIIEAADGVYPDPVSHIVFEVTDNDAAIKAVTDNGGKIVFRRTASTTGAFSHVSMVTDPIGNKVEILTLKK